MATTEAEVNQAHREKMARIKAAKDRLYAKTIEKGLLIVHTGTRRGKSTAAWGLAMRCLGHGRKLGVVQFVKGRRDTGAGGTGQLSLRIAWPCFRGQCGVRPRRHPAAGIRSSRAAEDQFRNRPFSRGRP